MRRLIFVVSFPKIWFVVVDCNLTSFSIDRLKVTLLAPALSTFLWPVEISALSFRTFCVTAASRSLLLSPSKLPSVLRKCTAMSALIWLRNSRSTTRSPPSGSSTTKKSTRLPSNLTTVSFYFFDRSFFSLV